MDKALMRQSFFLRATKLNVFCIREEVITPNVVFTSRFGGSIFLTPSTANICFN